MTNIEVLERALNECREIHAEFSGKLAKVGVNELGKAWAPGEWTLGEVLEHMILAEDHYVAGVEAVLGDAENGPDQAEFEPKWLPRFIIKALAKGEGSPAPKPLHPHHSVGADAVIERFLQSQKTIIALLDRAQSKRLDTPRMRNPFFKLASVSLAEWAEMTRLHWHYHAAQIRKVVG